MLKGLFVTGTDTEVGKTHVAAALLRLLGSGPGAPRVAGYKPVAAGVDADGHNEDVQALRAASNITLSTEQVCPALLPEACAPHIAARLAGRAIALPALVDGARALATQADLLVVEGVGGFCVPLDDAQGSAELAQRLALPVVLVVGLRLGCINHALLTAEAVAARGLRLAGWVGTRIDPAMRHADDNVATLTQWLQRGWAAPCLGIVPHLTGAPLPPFDTYLDAATVRRLPLSTSSLQEETSACSPRS